MDDFRARLAEAVNRAGLSKLPPGVLVAGCAIAIVALGLAVWKWAPGTEVGTVAEPANAVAVTPTGPGVSAAGAPAVSPDVPASADASGSGDDVMLYVHVVGAVRHAGLYPLPPGSRVADAIESAGGLLGSAAERALNLARPLSDGEQIVVPTQDEYAANPSGPQPMPGTAAGAAPVGDATASQVNINTADAGQLDTLPGVGPSTAEKIIAEREANGPFQSADDLARVPGIGPKKLESLKDLVTVR